MQSKFNWEVYDVSDRHVIATLHGGKVARLTIGKKLVEAGFDVNLKYTLLFDTANQTIGLKPGGDVAVVQSTGKSAHIYLVAFCRKYKLSGKYSVESFSKDDDIWVLPLTQKE